MKRRRLIAALIAVVAGAALGEESDQVLVTYEIPVAKGRISGVSRSLTWRATQLPDGAAQVELHVPVASFDSGHPQFDSLVREVLRAGSHPDIEAEGAIRNGRFDGVLTLRGVSRPVNVPMHLVRNGRQMVIDSSFAVDLAQFGVAIPGAGSQVRIDFVACLSADRDAVQSGGGVLSSN